MSITYPDGTVKRHNSFGERFFIYQGFVWFSYPGFQFERITESLADAPSIEIDRGISTEGLVTFTEAVTGLVKGAPVQIISVDYESGAGHIISSKWRIGTIDTDREGNANFTVVSLERRTKQLYLEVFSPPCKWKTVGGFGCEKDMTDFTRVLTVVTNPNPLTLTVSGGTDPDDFFALGALKFLTGASSGQGYDVRKWVLSSGTLKLDSPLRSSVAPGDTITIHAGCDKTDGPAGCSRFSNFARRFAHPMLPDENLNWPVKPEPPVETETAPSDPNDWFG